MLGSAETPAQAQTGQQVSDLPEPSAEEIIDIVVVARKREERLIRIPETVQAMTAETIERAGISSLADLGRQLPNVILNRRQDNEPNVVIRGIGAFGNTQGVGFYIDDVQNYTDQSAAIEDVERIEVLKGPQGTLYGGANVGGAIKYILKQPDDELVAEARGEYGTFDSMNLFGAVTAPLSSDGTIAARVSGYWNRSDGFVSNSFLGGRPDRSREVGLRVALRWKPSDQTEVRLSYRHNAVDNGGNVYVRPNNVSDYRRTVDYSVDVANRRRVNGGIMQIEHDFGGVALTSLTSYTKRTNDLVWEQDFSSADIATLYTGDRNDTHVFTQELRLASDASERFDWIIGGYFSRVTNRGLTNNTNVLLGVDGGGPALIEDFNNADAAEKQYALFATANYTGGPVRIGGGLRINRVEFGADLLNQGIRRSTGSTRILPKLSLAYDVAPDTMIYANAAVGIEPGRINLLSGTADAYRPERAISYELGLKGQTADRRLSYEIAGFRIDYKDRQLEIAQLVDGVILEQIFNIGKSRSYGLEAGLSYRPGRFVTLSAQAGYLDVKWRRGNASGQPLDGLVVPFSPRFSAAGSVDWRAPLGNLEFSLRSDITHKGSFFWDLGNRAKAKPYQVVNVRAGLGSPASGWEFAIRAENLFDQGYYNEFIYGIFDTPDAVGNCDRCHLGAPGAPRRIMGSVKLSF